MFSLGHYLLAQAGSEVINNLQASDEKLQDLNNQLDVVKNDYINLVGDYNTSAFFNINNIYFWFLILGLVLLLFGLIYLLAELKQNNSASSEHKGFSRNIKASPEKKKEIVKAEIKLARLEEEPEPKKIANVSPVRNNLAKVESEKKGKIEPPQAKKKGPIKIKVVKVK